MSGLEIKADKIKDTSFKAPSLDRGVTGVTAEEFFIYILSIAIVYLKYIV